MGNSASNEAKTEPSKAALPPLRGVSTREEALSLLRFEGLAMQRDTGRDVTSLTWFSLFEAPAWREEAARLKTVLHEAIDDTASLAVCWSEQRALGAMLGNVAGDALGAPLEFSPVRYDSAELQGLDHTAIWEAPGYNRFMLKPGQWTDDASQALCLADSLLVRNGMDALDLRTRLLAWWELGYNNAFGADTPPRGSVGLGSNVGQSFSEFREERTAATTAGNRHTSGNGSIMRCAPVPIFFWRDPAGALAAAEAQSRSTHQGIEAAEAARLLTHIVVTAIRSDGLRTAAELIGDLPATFETPCYAVQCLAAATAEAAHPDNAALSLEDRDWSWKRADYRYCGKRARSQPGYIGSYAMDALAMALHCVWSTDSAAAAMLKTANLRGDSDSVCAVTGQIAGALYGVRAIPKAWREAVERWDRGGEVLLRGHLLYHWQASDRPPFPPLEY